MPTLDQKIDGLQQNIVGLEHKFGGLEQRFDGLEHKFGGLEQRFDGLEHKFDRLEEKLDKKFDQIDRRFEQVDKRSEASDQKFDQLLALAIGTREDLKGLTERVDRVEETVDQGFGKIDGFMGVLQTHDVELVALRGAVQRLG